MKNFLYGLASLACLSLLVIACKKDADTSPDCSNPPALTTTVTKTGCNSTTGALQITANGGVAPLQYSLDGTSFQASNSFANLAAGDYTITVKDAGGCTSTITTKVEVDAASISYENTIKSIIATNCAIAGCHVAGTGRPNFTQFATIQANAANIKTRTGNKSMPLVGSLTDAEIQQIACWVDAGAPNN